MTGTPTLRILAISGSARRESTNTAFLKAMKAIAPAGVEVFVVGQLDALPVFSPDKEGDATPPEVTRFLQQVSNADGIIISSPEYARAIPGGLKNAVDWIVSRFEIMDKPIALAHASHRGDDMLASLRLVLSTISSCFAKDLFVRIPLIGTTPEQALRLLRQTEHETQVLAFLADFAAIVRARRQRPAGED